MDMSFFTVVSPIATVKMGYVKSWIWFNGLLPLLIIPSEHIIKVDRLRLE